MSFDPFVEKENSIWVFVKLTPKAAHTRIQGLYFDTQQQAYLKVSVTAPPVDGRANQALIEFLSKKISCAPSKISFVRGETDRFKVLSIADANLQQLQKALLP